MSTSKYEEMSSILRRASFEEDVIDIFFKNRIDKLIFHELSRDDFRQLGVVALGDFKRLQLLKEEILDSEVSVNCMLLMVLPLGNCYYNYRGVPFPSDLEQLTFTLLQSDPSHLWMMWVLKRIVIVMCLL